VRDLGLLRPDTQPEDSGFRKFNGGTRQQAGRNHSNHSEQHTKKSSGSVIKSSTTVLLLGPVNEEMMYRRQRAETLSISQPMRSCSWFPIKRVWGVRLPALTPYTSRGVQRPYRSGCSVSLKRTKVGVTKCKRPRLGLCRVWALSNLSLTNDPLTVREGALIVPCFQSRCILGSSCMKRGATLFAL
jgi:hypothetical protein